MNNKEAVLNYVNNNPDIWAKGIHGLSHWQRVEKFGEFLAAASGADLEVVRLFAYTHDLGRTTDAPDPGHGLRSVKIIEDLYAKKIISLTEEQYQKLIYACSYHTVLLAHSDDITIRTCWDADRLDLWRVGTEPRPEFLYTELAKKPETLSWSKEISLA